MRPQHLFCPLVVWLVAGIACTDAPDDSAADSSNDPERITTGGANEYPRLEGTYASDCQGYTERLRDCGLLTSGPLQCRDPENDVEACSFTCLAIASCSILAEAECTGVIPVPLNSCFTDCSGFQCGSGERVPATWRCDDQTDCEDGSDEASCTFECGSGELVPTFYECDFVEDCTDGSDEANCNGFQCGSGELISPNWRCDLEADCADASDEAMCDWFSCQATGANIPTTWHCDGMEDCLDGSDEFDCAKLICD